MFSCVPQVIDAHNCFWKTGLLAGNITLFVQYFRLIMKTDDDKNGSVYHLRKELAQKRALRAIAKLFLSVATWLLTQICVFMISCIVELSVVHNVACLALFASHYLAFSAFYDLMMAYFGYYSEHDLVIREMFYDPLSSTSLVDFWQNRYHVGIQEMIRSTCASMFGGSASVDGQQVSSADAGGKPNKGLDVNKIVLGLPLTLLCLGFVHQYASFVATRDFNVSFGMLLFFLLHALSVAVQLLLAETENREPSHGAGGSSSMLLFIGQLLKKAKEAIPLRHHRLFGLAFLWTTMFMTLPLFLASSSSSC